jgi:uncharacterized membrane protein YoaK (UPF0700 family)
MFWIFAIASLLVLMGIVYLRGKADGLIAGYNTASPQDKAKYDIRRLRLVVAIFHFVLGASMLLFLLKNSNLAALIFQLILVVLIIVTLVLANTWAKKKTK